MPIGVERRPLLSRYKMYRGKRPPSDPMPDGIRQDSRWRTSHILRPEQSMVEELLDNLDDRNWRQFKRVYVALLKQRFRQDRAAFDKLARLATDQDVFIGCSCPTKANPRPDRCHTYLALEFMRSKYPNLRVVLPPVAD